MVGVILAVFAAACDKLPESGCYENPLLNPDGSRQTQLTKVEDNEANSDLFWFAPDVTIKDAQVHDRLVFQGFALTGGDRNPAYSFALGGAISSVASGSLNALGYGNAIAGATHGVGYWRGVCVANDSLVARLVA